MTAQILSSELTNLIQESKRKHSDLRQAAEKSLDELKAIRGSTETQIASELSQRSSFVNPFVIACGTKNAKFTGIAIVCLQRLIVSRSLPPSKLAPVLEALREATSAGLDVQLKILQGLPSLLQNYADHVKGDLLVTALNICFILQSSKNAIVNNTSAATLQQLVVSVFDKVVTEDESPIDLPITGEAPSEDGQVQLHASALDAYHVFNDLCLMTEGQRPGYLRFTGLAQTFGLELIESVLTNHSAIFTAHPEQAHVLRVRVMPLLVSSLKGKPNFATMVRIVRILYTILRRHLDILQEESGDALDIMTHLLDQDTAHWRRSLCMEVFRGIFAEPGLVRKIYMLYDAEEGEKDIMKTLTATFVRISTEKPSVIGLGQSSSLPVANPYANVGAATDQAMLEASGMTGLISGSVSDSHNTGISTQWGSMRVPCIDQLDKTDAPSIPESYLYSLALACITSLSEGLAKFVLPLTVPSDNRRPKRTGRPDSDRTSPVPVGNEELSPSSKSNRDTSSSFKKNPIPINPLHLEGHPLHNEVKICAQLVEECWPAILATCSTFMSAALDSEYYHGLVRAFQKFAHVAGLLQLDTPRDAFLTTLGKSAVPPNVFTACLNTGAVKPQTPTQTSSSSTMFGNARGLLSVDSLVSQDSALSEKPRAQSVEASQPALNTRNLLCLRALLNLGIALGPTLGDSWRIILETLQQADLVLFATGKAAGKTPLAGKGQDAFAEKEASVLLSNFNSEVRAVETAASRMLESTVDFPNGAFVEVVDAVCNLLDRPEPEPCAVDSRPSSSHSTQQLKAPRHHRMLSISTAPAVGSNQEDQFALAKLGDLASINVERLLHYPPTVSGWDTITDELIATLSSSAVNSPVRHRSADILVRFILESATAALNISDEMARSKVQLRLMEAFRSALDPFQRDDRTTSVAGHGTDIDIHRTILEGLKSILENCGESLLSGWDIAFDIIGTVFVQGRLQLEERRGSSPPNVSLMTRSGKLIRSSFNSLQLICSDFLASLPNSCFLILVDTLYMFCSQDDDLNIALTTVTFFWVLSDFLSGRQKSLSITQTLMHGPGDKTLLEAAANPGHEASDAALWMLLLLRLTAVASDQRLELRKSAIQTLLRIFDAYGDSLNSEAWTICIKSVIFRLLSALEGRLDVVYDVESDMNEMETEAWNNTAVVVLSGISELLANHLEPLSAHESFNGLWQELLDHFASLLDFHVLDINTATFKALGKILSSTQEDDGYNTDTVSHAWELWSRGIPISREAQTNAKSFDNQNCLTSYVSALRDVYRLIQSDLSVDRVQRMLTLLREALQEASVGSYVMDVEYVTPLQGQVLEVLTMVRTDLPGVPSAMITQVAEFVSLAFKQPNSGPPQAGKAKRTYVAMSKSSMGILQDLILKNASDSDIYARGSFATALTSLAKPVTLKYRFPTVTKVAQPWRVATTTAIAILSKCLPQLSGMRLSRETTQEIWATVVTIATGILAADWASAPASASIVDDQDFDISSFQKLRDLIIPALGAKGVADATRKVYTEALFITSILHPPASNDRILAGGTSENLAAMYTPRLGRTIDFPPTQRGEIAYVCLAELVSLLEAHHTEASSPTPIITIQPPTPMFPPPDTMSHGPPELRTELYDRLARTAAPYLIVRAGLSLRTYVADTPLRGAMPQPLSQRKEVTTILDGLVKLKSVTEAIPALRKVESDGRKHLLRLYPLLVRVVGVAGRAGDDQVLGLAIRALEVVGREFEI